MTEAISYIRSNLASFYSTEEVRKLSQIILCHITGLSTHQILFDKDRELSVSEKKEIKEIIERLKKSEPIQYIIGKCDFYNSEFEVNPSTLIPRPETEELVELIISNHLTGIPRIIDIGTGSGCIAISLAKYLPNTKVEAMDISPEALKTAKKNAISNKVNIQFKLADILQKEQYAFLFKEKYDVIVSNPPYVTEKEKQQMEKNVLAYEPHTALFVKDEDPLLFYKQIAEVGKEYLVSSGRLYFEINRAYGKEIVNMLHKKGYTNISLTKDLYGNDRIITAEK